MKKGRRETFVPRRHTRSRRLLAGCYLLQQPEPQHPACSAFRPAVGHSSTQQSQVQLVHTQLPVSQHPQQPVSKLLLVAGTKGTRASAAKRIRLFMVRILFIGTLNRSLHVTPCDRGKATECAIPSLGSSPRTERQGSVADSIPPDTVEDPHWPDRNGE